MNTPNSGFKLRLGKLSGANMALLAAIAIVLGLGHQSVQAQPYYWDTNGATAGSGAATGTWSTSNATWTTDSTGSIVTSAVTTTNADDIFFSAGTNGTTGTVTVNGTQSAHSITFQNPVALTLSGGTALNLGNGTPGSGIFVTANAGNATNTISTPVILNSAATAIAFSNNGTGLLTIGGAVTGAATSGTQTINFGASTGNITLSGIIGNGTAGGNVAVAVNNASTGITTLSGLNTYTGGTTLSAGTLRVTGASALGTGAVTLGNGTTLANGGAATATLTNAVTAGGDISFIGTTGVGGTLRLTGGMTLTGNRTFTFSGFDGTNGAVALGGIISGNFSLTVEGSGGQLQSSGVNTYSGGTIINSGSMISGLNNLLNTGAVTINGGSFTSSFGAIIGALTLNNGVIGAPAGSGLITASSFSLSNGTVNAGFGGSGSISKITPGTVALNAYGTGTGTVSLADGILRLGAAQRDATTQTVTTTNLSTTVTVADGSILSVGQGLTAAGIPANALIQSITGNQVVINRTPTASGTVPGSFTAGGPLRTAGAISFSGGTLQYSAANQYDYSSRFSTAASQAYKIDTNSQNVTYSSNLTSLGGTLEKLGAGTLTLNGSNTYNGTTTVSGGTLAIGASERIANTSNLLVNGGTFDVGAFNETVGTVTMSSGSIGGSGNLTGTSYALQGGTVNAIFGGSGAVTVSGNTTTLGSAGRLGSGKALTISGGQLTIAGAESVASYQQTGGTLGGTGNTLTSTDAYDLQAGTVNANLGGSIGVNKTTAGTLTLTGSNSYTGNTTVSAGTLFVNGSLAAASAVIVNAGTLGGNGTISGSLTVNSGGTLAPGNSPGIITVGTLVLNAGSTTVLEINAATSRGTSFDGIDITATTGTTLTYGGNLTFSFGNGAPFANNSTLDLFNFTTGTFAGNFANVTSTGTLYSGTWTNNSGTWSLISGGQTLNFAQATGDLSVVPEPGTWALLAFSLTTALVFRRRRRRCQ